MNMMRLALVILVTVFLGMGCEPPSQPSVEAPQKKVEAPPPPSRTQERSLDPVSTPIYAGEDTKEKIAKFTVRPAISGFQEAEGRNPSSLDELVQKQYLPKLPPVPAGRKFTYNPETGEFNVVPRD